MIIGNDNFNNKNNFENKWNELQKHNQERPAHKNVFVKDIKEQKYANAKDTSGMQDKTLAMLQNRLENNLISSEEFNQKCIELGEKRQNTGKKNKLF